MLTEENLNSQESKVELFGKNVMIAHAKWQGELVLK